MDGQVTLAFRHHIAMVRQADNAGKKGGDFAFDSSGS